MEREKIIEAAKELCRHLIKSTDSSRFYCPHCEEANIPCGFSTEIVKVVKKALIPEGAVVLTKEECDHKVILDEDHFERALNYEREKARKEMAKEILQRVVNICNDEENFQDGTVNTQLEPLYFGIANGCAYVKDEIKNLAEEYGVEVEE